jgi:cellulose synthase/poly-beta-1,6-N-acetylglucosamine synthase-like glycosyltransferase
MSPFHRWFFVCFWLALLLPFYSYVLYPLLLLGLGKLLRFRGSRVLADVASVSVLQPAVAIVVSAYNEELHIANLVNSFKALDYSAPLTLYVGSDGSTDRTVEILEAAAGARVRVLPFLQNRGKATVLNDLLASTSEPIVAFTDANCHLDVDSLSRLVRHFRDPKVGAVCGELQFRSVGGDNVDGVYWRLERFLKHRESTLGALLGANGGIYAIRRACFVPIPPDTIIDDFCIAMTISAAGWSLVYEPEARAYEDAPLLIRNEFQRRVRIGTGNYQAFFRHPEYLYKTNLMTRFAYFSHKVLRWFTPHLLLLALLVNSWLLSEPLYRVLWILQLGTYALCLFLYTTAHRLKIPGPLRWLVFLVAMNAAFTVGFYRYVTGRYSGSWARTVRA